MFLPLAEAWIALPCYIKVKSIVNEIEDINKIVFGIEILMDIF